MLNSVYYGAQPIKLSRWRDTKLRVWMHMGWRVTTVLVGIPGLNDVKGFVGQRLGEGTERAQVGDFRGPPECVEGYVCVLVCVRICVWVAVGCFCAFESEYRCARGLYVCRMS